MVNQVVPAFKNRKRIAGKRLVTDKKVKARMRQLEDAFVSQLSCAIERETGGTLTAQQVRFWIAYLLPADDCWTCVPELIVTAEQAESDGATITIERLL